MTKTETEILDSYMLKSENLSLTFLTINRKKLPSPAWEGMKGRGDQIRTNTPLSTPTLALPHRKGEGIIGEISNMFG